MAQLLPRDRIQTEIHWQDRLNLAHMNLTTIPVPPTPHTIRILHLSHNQIISLRNIEHYPHLSELRISFNKIASWRQFTHLINPLALRILSVKGNKLESQPNYRLCILNLFSNLENLDEDRILPPQVGQLNNLQEQITQKIILWTQRITAMNWYVDSALTQIAKTRIENMKTLEAVKQFITTQHSKLVAMRDLLEQTPQTLLDRNQTIRDVISVTTPSQSSQCDYLTSQDDLEKSIVSKEEFKQKIFQRVFLHASQQDKGFAKYLLRELEISDQRQEQALQQDSKQLIAKLLSQAVKLARFQKFPSRTNQPAIMTSSMIVSGFQNSHIRIQQDQLDQLCFPYFSTHMPYVEGTFRIILEFVRSSLETITASFPSLVSESINSQPLVQVLAKTRVTSSQNSIVRLPQNQSTSVDKQHHLSTNVTTYNTLVTQHYETQPYPANKIPTSLVLCFLNILQNYQKRIVFKRIQQARRFNRQATYTIMSFMEKLASRKVELSFRLIKNACSFYSLIQKNYWLEKTKNKVFRFLKIQVRQHKKRKTLLMKFSKKQAKLLEIYKKFAFKKWRMLCSRTLKYINSIKVLEKIQTKPPKKQNTLDQLYQEVRIQRFSKQRSATMRMLLKPRLQYK